MPTSLHARPFTAEDAHPLTALLHEAYADLGARGLNYTAVDQDVATTRARASGGQCWVVESDGVLVATLTMSLPPSAALQTLTPEARVIHRAWLNQVAVAPPFRGRGIARDLWSRGQEWALAQHATSVDVDTATPATHLLRLYEGWDFNLAETIQWPGKTYRSTVMTRPLTA